MNDTDIANWLKNVVSYFALVVAFGVFGIFAASHSEFGVCSRFLIG